MDHIEYLSHMQSYYSDLLILAGSVFLRENPEIDPESFVNYFLPEKNKIIKQLKKQEAKTAKREDQSKMRAELNETLNRIESNLSSLRGARIKSFHRKNGMRPHSSSPELDPKQRRNKNEILKSKSVYSKTNPDARIAYYRCNYTNNHDRQKNDKNVDRIWIYHPAHWLPAELLTQK